MIYAAFLRGINVGGKNPVSMATLREAFERLGFTSVRTYINSGNVVFCAGVPDSRVLETTIEGALERELRMPLRVVARSLAELEAIAQQMPASWRDTTELRCNVIFLRHEIDEPAILDDLHPKDGIEELAYHPGVLFWAARRDALTRSSMLKLSTLPIYAHMTVRNPTTTLKVLEMMRQSADGT
ncbi:MAG: DUF1697 domain-containing protein [Micromonosporaceae bacterium]